VKYNTVEEAKNAAELLHGTEWEGRRLIIKDDSKPEIERSSFGGRRPRGRGSYSGGNQGGRRQQPSPGGNQLYVGNLPWTTTWQDLKDLAKSKGANPTRADVAVG
jgi:RNA recognition motif-containing protein